MRNMDRVIFGCFALLVLGSAPNVEACSTDAWFGTGGIPPNAVAGTPLDAEEVSRYSGICGLEVTGQAHVEDDNPVAEPRYRARFYVYPNVSGSGTYDIFVAYSDAGATTPLFAIRHDGTNLIFDATDAGGASTSMAAASGWNQIEIDWNTGGNFAIWLNQDATVDPSTDISAGAGAVEAVRLGAPGGLASQSGEVTFDAFQSHRNTVIGPLLKGDANGNGSITIADVIAVGNELNDTLATGQPDCNENGSVTIADVICVGNSL